jgi:hypothetical protein
MNRGRELEDGHDEEEWRKGCDGGEGAILNPVLTALAGDEGIMPILQRRRQSGPKTPDDGNIGFVSSAPSPHTEISGQGQRKGPWEYTQGELCAQHSISLPSIPTPRGQEGSLQ